MKTIILLIAPLLVASLSTAQTATMAKVKKTRQSEFRFSAHLGFTPLKTSPGTLVFTYVDESPSEDNLDGNVSIESTKRVLNIGGQIDAQAQSGLFGRIGIEGAIGRVNEFEINLGAGFDIDLKQKARFRIIGMISYGSAWIRLGDIYQNAVYIEVNNIQFYSESVAMKLSRRHLLFHPEIELAFPMKQNKDVSIFFNAGYQFPLRIKTPHLSFSGEDSDSQSISASESISAKNLFINFNGNKIYGNIIGVNGLTGRIGVTYTF